MRREIKQEASMSVQSRISATTLAELDAYWMSEGKHIKTLSQLVSWSLDLLTEILWANRKLRYRVESIVEARRYLLERELCQPSLHERGFDKMGTAVKFEGMREEGIDPSKEVRIGKFVDNQTTLRQYNMLHNKNSVQPFMGKVDSDEVRRGVEIMESLPKNENRSDLLDELSCIPLKVRSTPKEIEDKMRMIAEEEKESLERERIANDEFLASVRGKKE